MTSIYYVNLFPQRSHVSVPHSYYLHSWLCHIRRHKRQLHVCDVWVCSQQQQPQRLTPLGFYFPNRPRLSGLSFRSSSDLWPPTDSCTRWEISSEKCVLLPSPPKVRRLAAHRCQFPHPLIAQEESPNLFRENLLLYSTCHKTQSQVCLAK